jgi:hypothetical protein
MRQDSNSGVFSAAYLNTRVQFDIQSAVMERPSIDGLTRAFTHMSIRCDPRAPKNVPRHVKDALPPDPKILEWEEERRTLHVEIKCQYGLIYRADETEMGRTYQTLVQKINARTKRRDEDLKKVYRRQYFYRIHNEELQRLLNNVETEEYVEPIIHHQLPERTRLQEVICHFPHNLSLEQIVQRRVRVVDLMVALCSRREEPQPKECSVESRESSNESSTEDYLNEQQPSRKSSPDLDPFPLTCEKTQCIFCYPTKKTFSRPAKMMDHVESHLRLEPADRIGCRHPVCQAAGLVLGNIHQFKGHVQTVHGITLRDPWFVRSAK